MTDNRSWFAGLWSVTRVSARKIGRERQRLAFGGIAGERTLLEDGDSV